MLSDSNLHLQNYVQLLVSLETGSTKSILRGYFPQKVEPQHRSLQALRNKCS